MSDHEGDQLSVRSPKTNSDERNLRDRIAAAIYATPPVWDQWPWDDLTDDARQVWREQADAVIAVLREGDR